MSILRRILRIDKPEFNDEPARDDALEAKARRSEDELKMTSQELRQTVQRLESRARVFSTWNGAMRMVTRGEE